MRKPIILAGASRSGKTTLARRLQKATGFSLISGDALVSSFGLFPELGISQEGNAAETTRNFQTFLRIYLDHTAHYQNIPFILDIFHLSPEYVIQEKLHEKYTVIFLGYPDISLKEKLSNIRQHKTDHYDWTDERSDEDLSKSIAEYIEYSKSLQKSCDQHGLPFINTSDKFSLKLDTAFSDIMKI